MHSIAVIIPTCDRQEFLAESIQSVRRQTYPPAEIIVVNNGQKRLAPEPILKGVTIVELEPRCGVSRARNAGAEKARSEFLAFLDDDDLWAENYLEEMVSVLTKGPYDCAIAKRIKFYADGRTKAYSNGLPDKPPEASDPRFYKAPGVAGNNLVMRRAAFAAIGGFDTGLITSEDQDFFVRLTRSGAAIGVCPDAICMVRQHDTVRLRQKAVKGSWDYFRKHAGDATTAQKIQMLATFLNAVKKQGLRLLRLRRTS